MADEGNVIGWAVVELMGHARTAGRIEIGGILGLVRVDVPADDTYVTSYYSAGAIYSIKMVSEDIARAYKPGPQVLSYDIPIVPRSMYDEMRNKLLARPEQDDDDDEDEDREDWLKIEYPNNDVPF